MTSKELSEFIEAADAENAKTNGTVLKVGKLKPEWGLALQGLGITPETHEIYIRDIDARHTLRPKKMRPLPKEWYKNLSHHLQHPSAVLLDTTHSEGASLLLIIQGSDTAYKLVVRLNYNVRKQGVMNIVGTGQLIDLEGIKGKIGKEYVLIEGSL
ncbi:MAG: hypothetical protein QM537_09525 [Candidatus Symbiobacter sp.]|nr:hypothetical protein [Candidatus Symbiobacter sp.]